MKISVAACAVFLAIHLPAAFAAQAPEAESFQAKAVRYTRLLEQQPLDLAAPGMRSWLAGWIQQTPDVVVVVCDVLGPVPGEDVPFAGELLLQYMAGNASFQLQNPADKSDPVKHTLAGIDSMLLAYRSLLKSSPEARIPVFDEWIRTQPGGEMKKQRTAAILEHCSEPLVTREPGKATDSEVAAERPGTPFLGGFLRETRVLYPLEAGDWKAKSEKRYDTAAGGVSIRYASEAQDQGWIDVFVYPIGAADDARVLTLARAEREGLIQTWLKDSTTRDISELGTFPLLAARSGRGPSGPLMGYSVDLAYVSRDERFNSAMALALHQMYIVKTRFSARERALSREQVRGTVEQFTARLLPRLTIASTGDCWEPLPIERLDVSAAAPEGHLVSVQEEGVGTVFVYRDRVLAHDPDGPAAEAGMRKGMEVLGRLHPGCSGSEPTNPRVEEGMREIRLEYRAPAETPPAGRLPIRRHGIG